MESLIQKIGDNGGGEEIAKFLENVVYMNEGGKKKKKTKSRWD